MVYDDIWRGREGASVDDEGILVEVEEEEVSSIKNKKGLERGEEMRILNKSDISADEITMREGNNNDNPFEDAFCGSMWKLVPSKSENMNKTRTSKDKGGENKGIGQVEQGIMIDCITYRTTYGWSGTML